MHFWKGGCPQNPWLGIQIKKQVLSRVLEHTLTFILLTIIANTSYTSCTDINLAMFYFFIYFLFSKLLGLLKFERKGLFSPIMSKFNFVGEIPGFCLNAWENPHVTRAISSSGIRTDVTVKTKYRHMHTSF